MTLEETSFAGLPCIQLEGAGSAVFVTTSVGPRVLGLVGRGPNLMAVLPHSEIERADGPPYRFVGGHRLWAAPEVPEVTYQPDDRSCAVSAVDDGIRVEGPPDGAGLVKTLELHPAPDGWIVEHELRNEGDAARDVAPWAITQLRPGGRAELPLSPRGDAPRADRALVLWPYTDLDDPRLSFGPAAVTIEAPNGPGRPTRPVKVGAAPGAGRLCYRLGDEVFEKRAEVDPGLPYPDRGAASQVFVSADFCELETLGPLCALEAGMSAVHRETWTLRAAGS